MSNFELACNVIGAAYFTGAAIRGFRQFAWGSRKSNSAQLAEVTRYVGVAVNVFLAVLLWSRLSDRFGWLDRSVTEPIADVFAIPTVLLLGAYLWVRFKVHKSAE